MFKEIGFIGIVGALAACESGLDRQASSGFVATNQTGEVAGSDGMTLQYGGTSRVLVDGDTHGIAFGGGARDGKITAFAALLPQNEVSETPTTGSATYNADYSIFAVSGIDITGATLSGTSTVSAGEIALAVDFDTARIVGNSGDGLQVEADFTGAELDGTAIWKGLSGPLKGQIGSDKIIGAFHGDGTDRVHAGGFLGTPAP